jgi:Cof subfamily protein (haloacid dehalogenase superfamily)
MRKINYPLIVSDFDGTLVKEDGTISEKNKKAIAEYIAAGGKFAISTGRLPSGILSRAQELGLQGNVCCCQGAIILDIQTKEVILEGRMSFESTLTACKRLEELGLHIQVYDLWDYYCNMDDEPLHMYEAITKTKATLVLDKPLSQFIQEKRLGVYKLLAMVEPEKSDALLQLLSNEKMPGCEVTKSADFLVEIIGDTYSKGTAVQFLAEYYGLPLEKTIAVGDQCNDLSMIEKAGLGIAVANADGRLKDKANLVCPYTNEEDAIAWIIEHFGFCMEE